MKRQSERQRDFDPLRAKTFAQVLTTWLATEFPHLGGHKVRALFVADLMAMIDTYYVTAQHLKPGQTLWFAVDKTDPPRDRRTMAQTRLVPVVLEAGAGDDSPLALVQGVIAQLTGKAAASIGKDSRLAADLVPQRPDERLRWAPDRTASHEELVEVVELRAAGIRDLLGRVRGDDV